MSALHCACPNCQQRLQFPGAPPINRTVLAPPIAPAPVAPPQPAPVAHFAPAPVPVENTLDFSQASPRQHRHEYEDDEDLHYRRRHYQDRGPGGLAIASLVLGVVALVTVIATCLWPVSMACAILGIIFACASISNRSSGMATAGLVTSLIALALMLVVLIAAAAISV